MNQTLKSMMTKTFLHRIALVTALGLTAVPAFALPSDRQQSISLVADRATFNERTGVTTYSGNVIIEQGTMKLQAASIVANLNAKKRNQLDYCNGFSCAFSTESRSGQRLSQRSGKQDFI